MKKKEQPKPKQKEFTASPFQALKGKTIGLGKQDATPAAPPKQAKPAAAAKPVKKPQELEDELLFLDAVMGVRPLHPKAAAPARVKEHAAARAERAEEEERIFLEAVEALKMDVRFGDSLEEEPPARPAPVNRLRQVRRGSLRIDLQLDLHGLTRDEAIENLERFVKAAYNRGQKGVLVITGKGNNSAGEPVLKAAVASWLREAGKGMVSEFVQAPQEMGGGGAVVVFLKEKKAAEAAEAAEEK